MESRSRDHRKLVVFAGVLAIAGVVSWHAGWLLPWPLYWGLAVAAAALLAVLSGGPPNPYPPSAGPFLCDRCKYDDPRTCSRPERPNATRCPDHRPRGSTVDGP